MIIFIEGADGSGKTTLTEQLSAMYPTVRVTHTAQNNYPYFWAKLDGLAHDSDKITIVADRCPISEYVYRMLDGEPTTYKLADILFLMKHNLVIYCRTATQWQDAMNRGEDNIVTKVSADFIDRTYDFMMRLLKQEDIDVVEYDWQHDSVDNLINKIKTKGEVK